MWYVSSVKQVEDLLEEMEGRYDGAPDSNTRWMGEYLEALKYVMARIKEGKRWNEDQKTWTS